jgi:hypothetical protein
VRPAFTEMRRRHHCPERGLDRSLRIREKAGNTRERFVRLGVKDVEDRADQQGVTGFLPMVPPFQRSLRVNQNIGDVLDVTHLPFAAANFEQRIVSRRLGVGRIKQQHATVLGAEARRQAPVLTLDVMHDATARPCQQGRHHQADALAGPGRRETQHMFRAIVAQVVVIEPPKHDAVRRDEAGDTDLR